MKTIVKAFRFFLTLSAVSIMVCLSAGPALGQVHEVWVDDNWIGKNPGETVDGHVYGTNAFSKIQDGIDAISGSGTANVAAGFYSENITLKDTVQVLGAGAGVTTIDGGGTGAVVSAYNVGSGTIIEGFSIQNGWSQSDSEGAGVDIGWASPIVRNNTIKSNQGLGICTVGTSTPQISGNAISENTAGIRVFASQPLIARNVIRENAGHGIEAMNTETFSVINNVIDMNGGDGAKLSLTSGSENIELFNNTIARNIGAGLHTNASPSLHFLNNIAAFNGACGILYETLYDWGEPESDFNAFWGNAGGHISGAHGFGPNDLVGDPMFVDLEGADYHLSIGSPCIYAASSSAAPDTDIEGNSRPQGPDVDMGAYEAMGYVKNRPFIASFGADVTNGTAPFEVTFTCVASDPDGAIESYEMHYDDGSSDDTNATGVFTHSYTTGGTAYARCRATDDTGIVVQSRSLAIVRRGNILVPSESATIQAGIDVAVDGDTLVVAAGTYRGNGNKNLDFKGKAITVRSQNGPAQTIIDCENEGNGFSFHSGETAASIVSGFTIQNGKVDFGGGISFDHASPTIENCIVGNNQAMYSGAGIHCWYGSPKILGSVIQENSAAGCGGGIHVGMASYPIIEDCEIFNNQAEDGGGIYSQAQDLAISRCRIRGNSAEEQGGGIYLAGGAGTITNALISGNSADDGGGVFTSYSSLKIVNCTISGNAAQKSGGGVHFWGENLSSPSSVITNTILWENTPAEIFTTQMENLVVSFSDIFGGYPGEGNRFGDPSFADAAGGDFHLLPNSPCMYAGTTTDAPDVDIEGNPRPQGYGIDMGAYETSYYNVQRPIIDSFTADRTQYHVPFEVTLNCSAHDPDGEIANYTIDYGDGSPTASAAGGVFHHVYDTAGISYATCTAVDDSGAGASSFYIGIEVRPVLSPGDFLNIFGMEIGNRWTYEGSAEGVPYVIEREITDVDHHFTFPVDTYVHTINQNGSIVGWEWYENAGDSVYLWGATAEYQGAFYTFHFAQGMTAAWFPMQIGDHRYSDGSASIEGLTFSVSMAVDVIGKAAVALQFDTVDAYAVRYQMRIWGNGMDITDTFTWWMAPYLGVVRVQYSDDLMVDLTGLAIGGGSITLTGDADDDGLSDYRELFVNHTHMQFADTDFDGCDDGREVSGNRNPTADDPQGDLNADCAVDLKDAAIALQISSGFTPDAFVGIGADATMDSKIDIREALFILQRLAE